MTPRQPWSRQEYDALEQMLLAGLTYQQIADRLGRTKLSVKGTAHRIGLGDKQRQAHKRIPEERAERLREIIADCVEIRRLTCLDTTRHLNAIGESISNAWVHKQIQANHNLRKKAKENARRRHSVLTSVQRSVQRAAGIRRADPNSIRSRLKAAGISPRSYYNVREELVDIGDEFTPDDIIQICQARRRA